MLKQNAFGLARGSRSINNREGIFARRFGELSFLGIGNELRAVEFTGNFFVAEDEAHFGLECFEATVLFFDINDAEAGIAVLQNIRDGWVIKGEVKWDRNEARE